MVVPRIKPGKEQCIRAQRMAARGLLRMLHPDQMTPATLLHAVQSELAALARRDALPHLSTLDGLEHVTAAIFDLIELDSATCTRDPAWRETQTQLAAAHEGMTELVA